MLSAGLFLSIIAVVVLSDGDVETAVREMTTTKDGATWCPVPVIGTQCPASSIFHYYKCCGTANKECCFNLQTWVIVVLAVVAVMMLASFVLSVLRCLFCRR
ncbi:hypothetical protein LOAG_06337 [Loa loa]|uniref:Uncharacterized protein n=1 Tax=Loa loa TaxID=7209 RepID=A0A1I7W5D4_LOALO|nr:hypothetical protein LOAG_06337 [Loa loa]EFO22154.1 hypothetical protein LOAG_06337 [Loa loa]